MLAEIKAKPTLIIHYAIVLFLCLIFPQLTPLGVLTPKGMALIGCFFGAVYGWTFITLLWPSIISIIGMGWFLGFDAVAASAFGNSTVVMLFFMLMLTTCLSETGAVKWLMEKLLGMKFFLGKPWITIGFLFYLAFLVASLNSVLMAILLVPILDSLFRALKVEPYTKLPAFVIIGVMWCLLMGQVSFPFIGNGFVLVALYSSMFGTSLDFVSFILFSVPLAVIMILIYLALMKFVFRVDVTPFENLTANTLGESKPISRDQKIAFALTITMIVCMLCSSISALGPIYVLLKKLTILGIILILLAVGLLLKQENGRPLVNVDAPTQWSVILITALVMVLSSNMSNPDYGITSTITMLVQPMLGLSPYVFIVGLLALSVIITHFATNLVLTIVLMPFLITFASAIGMNPLGVLILLFFTCQMALATPGGGAPVSAIFYGMTDWVTTGLLAKSALKAIPFLFIGDVVLGLAWANILF